MSSLLASRRARRRGIAFVILLAVSILLMAFSSNPLVREVQNGLSFAFRPIQGAVDGVAEGVSTLVGAIGQIDTLRQDNARLTLENERLANDNSRLEEYRRENEALTALLQLRQELEHETVAVQVIARESFEGRRLIVVDKGTGDGIAMGDVLVAQGGALAGRVTSVGPNFAKVTLITDGSSTVVGHLLSSAQTGEVVGQLGGVLVMRNIDAGVQISIDEEVFTAGIELAGGIRSPYPKGLVIGRVVDVERDANAVVQTAFLDPAADLDTLEFGLVITDYEGGIPELGEGPVPCDGGEDGGLPDGEVPCFTPTPEPLPSGSSAP